MTAAMREVSKKRQTPKGANLTQQIGMLGVHLVAAEFIRRGFIVALTSREAFGADLIVTDAQCGKAWSIQVKTTGRKQRIGSMSASMQMTLALSITSTYLLALKATNQSSLLSIAVL